MTIEFKSEAERLQHPIASRIPKDVWDKTFYGKLTDKQLQLINTPWEKLIKDYTNFSSLEDASNEQLLVIMRLFHPTMLIKDWCKFGLQHTNHQNLFCIGVELNDINILDFLEDKDQKTSSRKNFEVFLFAAVHGHLDVLKYLAAKTPDQLINMITTKNFAVFRLAARSGMVDVLRYLEQKAPELLPNMISSDHFFAFQSAAHNGHVNVLRYVVEKAHDQLHNMIAAEKFLAFRSAAWSGHLDVLFYLEEKASDQIHEYIAAYGLHVFRQYANNPDFLKSIMGVAFMYDHVESHYQENNHYRAQATASTLNYLDALREQQATFDASRVFDFQSPNAKENQRKALYGYYVLRHLIRQLENNQYGETVYQEIERLLMIPSIRALVIRNTTETMLGADSLLGNIQFARHTNELLRLAENVDDPVAIQQLLSIPEILAVAQESRSLNLREMAADRESSMVGLTPQEQKQLSQIEEAYHDTVKGYPDGISGVIEVLRQDLEAAFLSEEHKKERLVTFRDQILELPFTYNAFQALIHEKSPNPAELQLWNEVYYRNVFHTAWRYLSKPNRWMDPEAPYVTRNAHREGWSTFNEYLPMIAYLYCAAKDETRPPLDENILTHDRVELFMRALSLINRQHNWDLIRNKRDKNGVEIPGQTEQFDDMRGDRPSCFSGVKRNLFQALLSHPLYTRLNQQVVDSFIKEKIREHYEEVFLTKTAEELKGIKEAIEDSIYDFTEESEILKSLQWNDISGIEHMLVEKYTDEAKAFFPRIPQVLYCMNKLTDSPKPNTLINYYVESSFDILLDKLIVQKTSEIIAVTVNENVGESVIDNSEKAKEEIARVSSEVAQVEKSLEIRTNELEVEALGELSTENPLESKITLPVEIEDILKKFRDHSKKLSKQSPINDKTSNKIKAIKKLVEEIEKAGADLKKIRKIVEEALQSTHRGIYQTNPLLVNRGSGLHWIYNIGHLKINRVSKRLSNSTTEDLLINLKDKVDCAIEKELFVRLG